MRPRQLVRSLGFSLDNKAVPRSEIQKKVFEAAEAKWKKIDNYTPCKFRTPSGSRCVFDVTSDEPWFMIEGHAQDISMEQFKEWCSNFSTNFAKANDDVKTHILGTENGI